jgi:ATP sulfurylase
VHGSVAPHGGKLINQELSGSAREKALREAESLPTLELHDFELSDLEMIATGAMSPLTGFMGQKDFDSVVDTVRLASGLVWPIPIVFARSAAELEGIKAGSSVALKGPDGTIHGILRVQELYTHDAERHAQKVFGTGDTAHPGVARVKDVMGDTCVGGDIELTNTRSHADFPEYRLTPSQTRELFDNRGWKTIVAFQTRNPIHRAHEYLTKVALEIVDGLLVHPLVGETKAGDIPADVRMNCYKVLLDNYYPPERATLSVFPAAMRYGGPREAVFHALCRKNYGITHFIVGRDHAGVNKPSGERYYDTYEAQTFISQFTRDELGMDIFKFENTFFDRKTGGMVSEKTKPEGADPVFVSGTQLREMLQRGEVPPEEVTRPEVARILMESAQAVSSK